MTPGIFISYITNNDRTGSLSKVQLIIIIKTLFQEGNTISTKLISLAALNGHPDQAT